MTCSLMEIICSLNEMQFKWEMKCSLNEISDSAQSYFEDNRCIRKQFPREGKTVSHGRAHEYLGIAGICYFD